MKACSAGKRVDGRVEAGGGEAGGDGGPAVGGDVGVGGAEDHLQVAADRPGPGEGAGVGVGAELAVVDAGAVEAGRGADVGLQGGAEGEVAAEAEAAGGELAGGDGGVGGGEVEEGADVGVEGGGGQAAGVGERPVAVGVEVEGGAGGLDPVVDLGGEDDEAVARQPLGDPEHRPGELEDVGVEEDRREPPGAVGPGHEGPHRRGDVGDRDAHELGQDLHRAGLARWEWLVVGGPSYPVRGRPQSGGGPIGGGPTPVLR